MSIADWFKKGKTEAPQESEANRLFRDAMAQLGAENAPDALAGFRRVLQLTPENESALAWRETLANQLGLSKLDRAAQVIERFAYSHCGPGEGWNVDLREMHAFRPHQPPQTYDAALLDLCQTPPAFIEVTVIEDCYKVRLMGDRPVPGVSRTCLSEIAVENTPAKAESLMELLNGFVSSGLLVKRGNQLEYVPNRNVKD
jgi:hypothetical protein